MAARPKSTDELLRDPILIERAVAEGVRRALHRHKLLGESIVVWQDGRVVEIPPEQISVDPPPNDTDDDPTVSADRA